MDTLLKKLTEVEHTQEEQWTIEQTQKHIDRVAQFIRYMTAELEQRALSHDASKLESPEFDTFVKYTPGLKDLTYGSDEYKAVMKEMKPAIEHHNKVNRHHPEHFENGMKGMNLVDLMELIADWRAASERHSDGDVRKSIEMNQKRFGYDDTVKALLLNTVDFIESQEKSNAIS